MKIVINIWDLPSEERWKIRSLNNFCSAFHSKFEQDEKEGYIVIHTPSIGSKHAFSTCSVHLQSVLLFPGNVEPYHLPYVVHLELTDVTRDDWRVTDTANFIQKDLKGKFRICSKLPLQIKIEIPYLSTGDCSMDGTQEDLERIQKAIQFLHNTFPEFPEQNLLGIYHKNNR